MKHSGFKIYFIGLVGILCLFLAMIIAVSAQEATPEASDNALVERGHYLAEIGQCIECHTPPRDEYSDLSALTFEQSVTFLTRYVDAIDTDNQLLAGGRPLDLGPMGIIFSPNITPDEETGIGSWTDKQIETAIRLGIRPNGDKLHPIMAVNTYGKWTSEDMAAIIAFLHSIPAVKHEINRDTIFRDTYDGDPATALDGFEIADAQPTDPIERGQYLIDNVMRCTDCHTPLDPETGIPDLSRYLGGGQPFDLGPFGTIYSANISPDVATGIGAWSDQQISRVLHEGIRINNRHVIVMPWQGYSAITDEDLQVVLAYLRSINPVENEVPAPAVPDEYLIYATPES